MNETGTKTGIDQRRSPRIDLTGQVTIEFEAATLVGSGENISEQGVYFTTAGPIPVRVRIDGREPALPGVLVRVETIGDGRVGIAVRFREPIEGASA